MLKNHKHLGNNDHPTARVTRGVGSSALQNSRHTNGTPLINPQRTQLRRFKEPRESTKKSKSKSGSGSGRTPLVASKSQDHRETITTSSVDIELGKWPYCIVWTPLPIISWFVPIIGHTGIANSQGIIYDFSDDFNVSVDNFSFGTPTKYYQFHAGLIPNGAQAWDRAIKETSDYYSRTRHSLFFNNCHQYIAGVLNKTRYSHQVDWTQTKVWWMITFRSEYTNFSGFIRQWWPFTAILVGVIVFCCIVF